jgi:Cof subfamily protein (haloacid dehalogenase superfamily)
MADIKMVAVDVDGTFIRHDYSFDVDRFKRILDRMDAVGAQFVIASGNQYWQLRDYFPGYDERISFVAENGAYVKDHADVVFTAQMDPDVVRGTLDWIDAHPDIENVMSCLDCAYAERGRMREWFFEFMRTYYHRLEWVDSLRDVTDPVLKFALSVPEEQTMAYYEQIRASLTGGLVPTTSGHGAIDLIIEGNHKASGLARLAQRWGFDPRDCAAFGDGGNDIEMLRWVGHGYAVANASDEVKAAAGNVCPSNEDQGVLTTLEELFGL